MTAPTNFFELSNLGDEFLLQGFDFFNGLGDRGTIASCEACSLRVTDNRFRFNSATDSGHLLYVKDGRLRFFNNTVSGNGMFPGEDVPLIELANEFDDTSDPDQRDFIRNNTFVDNDGPTILSSGNGLDLSSNIFQEGVEAVVVDQSATADPVFRYNIFWDSDILFVDEEMDSIKVELTVRDTIVPEQPGIPSFELIYTIPDFVLFEPDTLIIFTEGVTPEVHDYFIDVGDFRDFWEFKALSVPEGVDTSGRRRRGPRHLGADDRRYGSLPDRGRDQGSVQDRQSPHLSAARRHGLAATRAATHSTGHRRLIHG